MSGVVSIVLVLAGLIFFHELGHFLAARLLGVGVRTFSVGFGKALWFWQGKKTRYQISLIPLGGYVDLVGMRSDEKVEAPFTEAESYCVHSPLRRLVTVAAGPLFNLLLAWLLYWALMWSGSALLLPEVGSFIPDSPAAAAGLEPGDMITGINGRSVASWEDLLYHVQTSKGESLLVGVRRLDRDLLFAVTPKTLTLDGEAGEGKAREVHLIGVIASGRFVDKSFFRAGIDSFGETRDKTLLMLDLVGRMFSREISLTDNLGGPVMVARTVHEQAVRSGPAGVIKVAAILSVNLGLLNLLPIPALDGGHILFNLIEMVFRRPVPERVRSVCTYFGFVFLVGLMLLATALDVFRLSG
ncbi:MAG: site-2 protease family protein [Deltaproteobacteria bacterium]|jgi:regulator of sigma E protease|nr:site-2 protease family protein [Deltaproteobacteria bacterium]